MARLLPLLLLLGCADVPLDLGPAGQLYVCETRCTPGSDEPDAVEEVCAPLDVGPFDIVVTRSCEDVCGGPECESWCEGDGVGAGDGVIRPCLL